MSIASDLMRVQTDVIILAQLNQHDSYGYEINKHIQEMTDGEYELKEATLYSTFRRLEKGGFIKSYWGDQQKGARRRYYKITSLGKAMLQDCREDWKASRELFDRLIFEGED